MTRRRTVRPVERSSILRKKFKQIFHTKKRVIDDAKRTVDPDHVISDLRRGSLESLGWYLEKHRSLPDRQVALKLQELISGSLRRTRYRIVVVKHPDAPENKGGRHRKSSDSPPTDKQWQIDEGYQVALKAEGKVEFAAKAISGRLGCSEATVFRALKKVKEYREDTERLETAKLKAKEALARRELALANLRAQNQKD